MPAVGPFTVATGLERQRSGDLAGAETIYAAILAEAPDNDMAQTLLGLTWCEAGREDAGIQAIRDATLIADNPFSHFSLGQALSGRARMTEAVTAFRRCIELAPGVSAAHIGLGRALACMGDHAGAAAALRQAMLLQPTDPEPHLCMGALLHDLGRPLEALPPLSEATRMGPEQPAAWSALGGALLALGRADDAAKAFATEVALAPDSASAHVHLGDAQQLQRNYHAACASYQRAIALRPDYADAFSNLGNALLALRQPSDAEAAYRQAIGLCPEVPAYHSNLGSALTAQRRVPEALAAQRQALALDPGFVDAAYNHSITLLLDGKYDLGWPLYETRWKLPWNQPRGFVQPRWTGEPLRGRTILLHAEQGLGDMLQMARYVPLVTARGGRVLLEVHPPLVRLLQSLAGVAQVLPIGCALPAFDVHCPMFSLPLVFGTRLDTIPAEPYIPVPEHRTAPSLGLRVGLVWSGTGGIGSEVNAARSIQVEQLAPLARLPGVSLCALQYQPDSQSSAIAASLGITDLMADVEDFADTAAIIAGLDLVISVDTSTAHLAAAMGKRVWLLSRYDGCWRWLAAGADSPWYPSMRVYRQSRFGDWTAVVSQVAADLAAAAAL